MGGGDFLGRGFTWSGLVGLGLTGEGAELRREVEIRDWGLGLRLRLRLDTWR